MPAKTSFSRDGCTISPVETMPMRSGQRAMCSGPLGEIARSSGSSQTLRLECQRAQGMPSLSSISVCHCSHRVAGAKMTIGLRRFRVCSASRHRVSAAVPSDSVLPSPTSSASSSRTCPWSL
jgi:hypothetical protein